MSKSNKEKDLKNLKSNKRTNSNSLNINNVPSNYTGMNVNLTTNQNDLITNTTGNISGVPTQNLGLVPNNTTMFYNQNISPNLAHNINTLPTMQNVNDNNKTPSSEEFKVFSQKVDCVGKIPTARFGHTVVLVSSVKIILFGGAVGDTRNFQFTNETYVLNLITKIWLKLEG